MIICVYWRGNEFNRFWAHEVRGQRSQRSLNTLKWLILITHEWFDLTIPIIGYVCRRKVQCFMQYMGSRGQRSKVTEVIEESSKMVLYSPLLEYLKHWSCMQILYEVQCVIQILGSWDRKSNICWMIATCKLVKYFWSLNGGCINSDCVQLGNPLVFRCHINLTLPYINLSIEIKYLEQF